MALSDDNVTLIALWDGLQGDGAGDIVMRTKKRGATFFHLDANELVNND